MREDIKSLAELLAAILSAIVAAISVAKELRFRKKHRSSK